MTHLQTRAAELRAAGRLPVLSIGYATVADDDTRATHVQIRLGPQPSGRSLYMADLDSHKEGQDAERARRAFVRAHPDIAAKMAWQRSQGGLGYHAFFESYAQLPTGPIYDEDGQHIGELLGSDTDRTLDPGDIQPGTLTPTQNEQLKAFWIVRGAAATGDRWTARAKEGRQYAAGWQRLNVTLSMLRDFLVKHCGEPGKHRDALFDERQPFNRSDEAGSLFQTILFNIHKIAPNAGYAERCRLSYAYWMAADSYGKADDDEYNQERDGCALLAKILHEDQRRDDTRWRAPFWAKSHPTPPPVAAAPEAAPRRPAHRPAGDQEKQIARFKRLLAQRWDDDERFYYFADDLDAWAARCGVRRRTIQAYLTVLEQNGQIRRGQESGRAGGRPWMTLLPAFFGMQITPESTSQPDTKPDKDRDADDVPIERITTPESTDRALYAKEDHQNLSAPAAAEPGGASYDPRYDTSIGGRLLPFIDPTVPRLRPSLGETPPPPRRTRRPAKHRAQQTFTRQDGELYKRLANRAPGPLPTPSPHRPRAGLPLESLPDVVGSDPARR